MEKMDDQTEINAQVVLEPQTEEKPETTADTSKRSKFFDDNLPRLDYKKLEQIYNVNNRPNNFFESSQSTENVMLHDRHCLLKALQTQYSSKIQNTRRELNRIRLRPYWVRQRSRTTSETADTSTLAHLDSMRVVSAIVPNDSPMLDSFDFMDISTTNNNNNDLLSATSRLRDLCTRTVLVSKVQALKKSKSLEDIRSENLDGSQPSHEMEFVSSRIQKLKVQE